MMCFFLKFKLWGHSAVKHLSAYLERRFFIEIFVEEVGNCCLDVASDLFHRFRLNINEYAVYLSDIEKRIELGLVLPWVQCASLQVQLSNHLTTFCLKLLFHRLDFAYFIEFLSELSLYCLALQGSSLLEALNILFGHFLTHFLSDVFESCFSSEAVTVQLCSLQSLLLVFAEDSHELLLLFCHGFPVLYISCDTFLALLIFKLSVS